MGIEPLHKEVMDLRDDMEQVKQSIIVHETRFGNGREVMADMKRDIEALQPTAPDWLKLMLAGFSVIGVLMGAQLWMTDKFNDRPTGHQVEKLIEPIKQTQKETAKEIVDIERSQAKQATTIKNIEREQNSQGKKLDSILDRLPNRRRKGR